MFLEIHRGAVWCCWQQPGLHFLGLSPSLSAVFIPLQTGTFVSLGGCVLFCRADGDRRSDGAGALLLEPALSLLIGKCWRADS